MPKDTRFVNPPVGLQWEHTADQTAGSSAQAAMLLALPEGMAELQDPFQYFLSKFLFGVLTSSQLQQGIPIALLHSSIHIGTWEYLHSCIVYYLPLTTAPN